MFRNRITHTLLAASTLVAAAATSQAAVIHTYDFDVPSISASAQASIELQLNHITVTLTHLGVDPKSVGQNISGFWFTMSSPVTDATLLAGTGTERTITDSGTYTTGSQVAAQWGFSAADYTITLNGLYGGPKHTIIGMPGDNDLYANANGSIAGNKPHNAFLAVSAVFEIDAPGVTADSPINGAQMRFGTASSTDIYSPSSPPRSSNVPEPASLALIAAGILLITKPRRTR